ncbi:MAG TPA: site-specific integrase, partial [Candidatus Deferrimicrobiaceae bacterium]|nr:site-specific integrase [Candidatus Deferrimicrobiaceae bacterium]
AVKVGSEKAAKAAVPKIEEGLSTGKLNLNDLNGKTTTFGEYSKKWLRGHVRCNLKPSTHEEYGHLLKHHLVPAFGKKDLGEIARDEIKAFAYAKIKGGLSSRRVLHIVKTVAAIFNHAIEDGIIGKNPASHPGKFIRMEDQRGKVQFLTPEEGGALLAAAREHYPRYHPLFLAALMAGLRQGELVALKWEDIDWHGNFIEVRRTSWGGVMLSPKSGKGRRVDMADHVSAALADHRRKLAAEAIKKGRPMPEWIFPNELGRILDASWLRAIFAGCLKKAGLRHVSFHALRHSFASWLIGNGESLAYVRDQMGHHSIQITVDTYGHLVPGANRQAVNRLGEIIGKSATPAQPTSQVPAIGMISQGNSVSPQSSGI